MATMVCTITSTTVIATGVTFPMVMIVMIALCFGIIIEITGYECYDSIIRIAADSAVQFNACLRQRHLRQPSTQLPAAADE